MKIIDYLIPKILNFMSVVSETWGIGDIKFEPPCCVSNYTVGRLNDVLPRIEIEIYNMYVNRDRVPDMIIFKTKGRHEYITYNRIIHRSSFVSLSQEFKLVWPMYSELFRYVVSQSRFLTALANLKRFEKYEQRQTRQELIDTCQILDLPHQWFRTNRGMRRRIYQHQKGIFIKTWAPYIAKISNP